MKIKFCIKYNESYVPPRCRKLRFREKEEYYNALIKEIKFEELDPAFDIGTIIYAYNNKLWRKATESDIHCVNENNPMTALEALIYSGTKYSTYYGRYEGRDESTREDRKKVIKRLKADMSKYLIVDGELYVTTYEPVYCIYTYGLGHNHGGTSLSIDNHYNINISKDRYFNALEYEKALEKSLDIATRRGDTDYLEYIKSLKPIKVLNEKYVTRKPQEEHGDGCSFTNSIEPIIENSDSPVEAGLLMMALLNNKC